jgi:hypothetical protein
MALCIEIRMISELPIRAVVVERFDLGFILKHPDGRLGQLRVPEMSAATAALDRSSEPSAGMGSKLHVYVVKELEGTCLFSEFSRVEREERERQAQLAIEARNRVQIGDRLAVSVTQTGDWGCICHEVGGLLEGVILSGAMLERSGWSNAEMLAASRDVGKLELGSRIEVVVARKEWSSHGRYVLYFGSCEQANA